MKLDLEKMNCKPLSEAEMREIDGGFFPFLLAAGFILLGTCGCYCERNKIVINTYDFDHSSMSDSDSTAINPTINVPLHLR